MSQVVRGILVRNRRSQRGSSEISQFIPALYILFMIVFLPLINLAAVFLAAGIQYLATNDFVSKASTQPDYPTALNAMASEAYQFQSLGLAQFISMLPQGGYTGCGDDLYVVTTNTASGTVTTSAANLPLAQPVDTAANIYELSVKSTYSMAPLINLSAVPLLGSIPGLGQPVTLTFTANRPVEHPGGLQAVSGTVNSIAVTPFNRVNSGSPTSAVATTATWRNPNIYPQILAAGKTIVSENVFIVRCNNPNWTSAGVTIANGQQIWIDTQAVGLWNLEPGVGPMLDANGYLPPPAYYAASPYNDGWPPPIVPGSNWGSLVGVVGTGGQPFTVGNTLTNYAPQGTGTLTMICNQPAGGPPPSGYFASGTGAQLVRVLVVQ